jgi:hypothetical protein
MPDSDRPQDNDGEDSTTETPASVVKLLVAPNLPTKEISAAEVRQIIASADPQSIPPPPAVTTTDDEEWDVIVHDETPRVQTGPPPMEELERYLRERLAKM